jgi:flagellar basal-body rod modification protein FlgD
MTAVNNNTATGGAAGAPAAGVMGNGEVSQLFTRLLIAQIQNQDPLDPADPSEFVGQMTSLSQMEALQQLTATNKANGAMLDSLQTLALGGHVGSRVAVATDRVQLGSTPVSGSFALENAEGKAALVLKDSAGKETRIALGARGAGDTPFTIDPAALGLAPGNYSLRVETSSGADPVPEVLGTLDSLRLGADGPILTVSNIGQVPSSAITGF